MLTGTGLFEDFTLEQVQLPPDKGENGRIELDLVRGEEHASVTLAFDRAPSPTGCWRTENDQHACTVDPEPAPLTRAEFRSAAISCPLEGWLERLDGAWQLDLVSGTGCAEGRLAALLEP